MKRLLHVGSGWSGREEVYHPPFTGEAWDHVRLDIDPAVRPDIVGDIVTLAGIADASFDGIYSSHNLEHLHHDDAGRALASFYRVLKPGGICVVTVPDFRLACEWVARGDGMKPIYVSPTGPITPFDMIFGYRPFTDGNPHQQHRGGFTLEWLQRRMARAGFTSLTVYTGEAYDLWGCATK